MRPLSRSELFKVIGGLCSYDSDTVPFGGDGGGGGGGGGGQPPSDPPTNGDAGDDYAYSAFFDDDMDAVETSATQVNYYISVEEAPDNGSEGGGDYRGYDSADFNGPMSAYTDYFSTQHGPESIDVRASITAGSFSNYADHQDQIRTDLTNIVQQAPDAATANQRIATYLDAVGLGGQLGARISDTGFAAAQQSIQQAGVSSGNDIIVNGYAYRVGTPNTIASFGSEGQFMLASFVPSTAGQAQVYGSLEGVSASTQYRGLFRLPKHMTDSQKAAVIYNETRGIEDPNDRQMVAAMIMQIIANNDGRAYLAASPLAVVEGSAQQAAWTTTVNAEQHYSNILASRYDMSSPISQANVFIMRADYSTTPWRGLTPLEIYGPFNATGSSDHYIRPFRDPAYAH